MKENPVFNYLRRESLPLKFCPGCGHGIILGAVARAIDELKLDMDKMVFVSGIGCAGWISSPNLNADTLHTTHGRAIPAATGVKTARPDLNVVVISGDGDLATIGGNHLIHAARRNIPMTVICANNSIYGMTGGQTSGTTPKGIKTVTDPQGNIYDGFDLAPLVKAAGAAYVARYTTFHVRELIRAVKTALKGNGFSFIEAVSQCPTHYGKSVGQQAAEMLTFFKEKSVTIKRAKEMSPDELAGKITIGEF
mgnify:CR=1 FL=1